MNLWTFLDRNLFWLLVAMVIGLAVSRGSCSGGLGKGCSAQIGPQPDPDGGAP